MQSQITHLKQLQTRIECTAHPGFDFDTICFNQTCKQKGNQIICPYCCLQYPHTSHTQQQYGIYKTSPGFRSINFAKDWYKLPQIMREREKIAEAFSHLKTHFTQLIDKMADISLKKLQCLTELLSKNAAFKVCNKIRRNYRKHLECCVEVINELQMCEEGNSLGKEQAYKLIEHKFKNECNAISNRIEHLKSLVSLFEASNQQLNRINNSVNIKANSADEHDMIEKNGNPLKPKKQKKENLIKREQGDYQKSYIDAIFAQQPHLSQREKNTSNNKPHIGIDFEKEGTVTIWNANSQSLNYLRHCKDIKNLIIEDSSLANTIQFKRLIEYLPQQFQGIHINCKSSIDPRVLKDLKVSYLNFFPSFRFIQNTDRSKYFSKVEYTTLDFVPQKYINNVSERAKYQRNNIYIYKGKYKPISDHITQINFIQKQSDQFWALYLPQTLILKVIKNVRILSLSNIIIDNRVSFTQFFKNNFLLHTFVLDGCRANYQRILYQLRSLNPKQLRHLQISGNNLEERITLTAQQVKKIFFHQWLETLILTNVNLGRQKGQESMVQNINILSRLTHLNLYGSCPISPKILEYLHERCRTQLKYLNIGCLQITNKQRFYKSPPFSDLQSLCLDYTQINQTQLAIFMKNSTSLKYLSIQNLNGEKIESEETDQSYNNKCYGLITPQFFMGLDSKSLKYVNIYNCFAFSEYSWEGFDDLECIRVNEGLLTQSTVDILKSKGIKLNIVQKSQLNCSRIKNFKKPFKILKQQQNEVNRVHLRLEKPKHRHYLEQNEVDSIQQSIEGMKAAESIGFRVLWNQVQSSEPVTVKSISLQSIQSMQNS